MLRNKSFQRHSAFSPACRFNWAVNFFLKKDLRRGLMGEKKLADAILGRIVHQLIRIVIYGKSLKKTKWGGRNNGIIYIKIMDRF